MQVEKELTTPILKFHPWVKSKPRNTLVQKPHCSKLQKDVLLPSGHNILNYLSLKETNRQTKGLTNQNFVVSSDGNTLKFWHISYRIFSVLV